MVQAKTRGRKKAAVKPSKPEQRVGAVEESDGEEIDKAELVTDMLKAVALELKEKRPKASVTEFIKLLELAKTLDASEPAAVEVKWVEPSEPG